MSKKMKILLTVIAVVIVAIIGVCVYFIFSSNKKIGELNNEINTYKISENNESAQNIEINNDENVQNTEVSNENVVVDENNGNVTNNENTTSETKNNVVSQNTTTSNSNNNEYDKANTAIKQALKNKSWLTENILAGDEDDVYFVKINDINSLPAYLIRKNNLHTDGGDTVRLITYIDGKVHVSNNDKFDYVNVTYDPGNNIVRMEEELDDAFGFDRGFVKYYKMETNGEFRCIKEIIFSDEFYGIGEKYGSASSSYLVDVGNYDANYYFTTIDIELTDANIDKYVK